MKLYTICHETEIKTWEFTENELESDNELYKRMAGYCSKINGEIWFRNKNEAIESAKLQLKGKYLRLVEKLESQRI